MQIYVVRPGDSVDQIAKAFSIPVLRLTEDNEIAYPYRLAVGQALLIREDADITGEWSETIGGLGSSGLRPELETNGYAYTYIGRQILEETIPFLTDLSVFSYGFTVEGELILPPSDDQWMIDTAAFGRTRPMLVLTPLGSEGRFNNNLVSVLVNNLGVQQRLIRALWETIQQKGYSGVDIDFEYVLAEDREPFAEFVARTTRILNQYGYRVTVALAPKTSRDQKGLLYEGIDYRLLGQAANQVMLMTYEWGYT